jgi:hypothetical protein
MAGRFMTRVDTDRAAHSLSVVRASLMLGFAGAVEQNLLDMPGSPLMFMSEGHLLNVFLVQKHLKEFHKFHKEFHRSAQQ